LDPYLRKFGKFTVPDFIGDRYYSNTARTVAVICALIVSFTYVAGQMRGVGIVFSQFLQVDINLGVIIGMAVVLVFAFLGGMKGITYTQVAQYCVLIFAFMVPAIFISLQMTGNPIPQLGMGSKTHDGVYLLDKLDTLHTQLGFKEYTSGTKSTWDVFAITLALMVGTAGLPHVIVRFFTVPKVKDARKSAGLALLFIAILYSTAPAIAVFSRTNLIETVSDKEYTSIPEWFKNWENTGLIAWSDKNGDGKTDLKDFSQSFNNFNLFVNNERVDSTDQFESYNGGSGLLFDSSFEIPPNSQILLTGRISNGAVNGDKVKFSLSRSGLIDPTYSYSGDAVETGNINGEGRSQYTSTQNQNLNITK